MCVVLAYRVRPIEYAALVITKAQGSEDKVDRHLCQPNFKFERLYHIAAQ